VSSWGGTHGIVYPDLAPSQPTETCGHIYSIKEGYFHTISTRRIGYHQKDTSIDRIFIIGGAGWRVLPVPYRSQGAIVCDACQLSRYERMDPVLGDVYFENHTERCVYVIHLKEVCKVI
jgi:hypothetical protein